MTQKKLNNIAILLVYKEEIEIDVNLVAQEFIAANEERKDVFGCFD